MKPTRALLVLLAAAAIACGDERPTPAPTPTPPAPTLPPPPPPAVANIAGTWTGAINLVHTTLGRGHYNVTVTLGQAGDQVTGTWADSTPNLAHGEITATLSGFAPDTTISGTATFSTETGTGTGRCESRTTIKGAASRPSMTWNSDDMSFATCSGTFTQVTWTLSANRPTAR